MALVWEGAVDAQEGKLDVHPRGHLLFVGFHPKNDSLSVAGGRCSSHLEARWSLRLSPVALGAR